jgi:hypothetical protein
MQIETFISAMEQGEAFAERLAEGDVFKGAFGHALDCGHEKGSSGFAGFVEGFMTALHKRGQVMVTAADNRISAFVH